jgi:hypothetical protein
MRPAFPMGDVEKALANLWRRKKITKKGCAGRGSQIGAVEWEGLKKSIL